MKISAACLVLAAYVAIALSSKCGHHEDPTPCIGHISCDMDTEMIGCEHETCTCVPAPPTPMNCSAKMDCMMGGMTCFRDPHGHDQYDPSCLNEECVCLDMGHGQHHP